MVNIIKISGN